MVQCFYLRFFKKILVTECTNPLLWFRVHHHGLCIFSPKCPSATWAFFCLKFDQAISFFSAHSFESSVGAESRWIILSSPLLGIAVVVGMHRALQHRDRQGACSGSGSHSSLPTTEPAREVFWCGSPFARRRVPLSGGALCQAFRSSPLRLEVGRAAAATVAVAASPCGFRPRRCSTAHPPAAVRSDCRSVRTVRRWW